MGKFNLQKKTVIMVLVILGSVMVVVGILSHNLISGEKHDLQMASGVIMGMGGAFLSMGLVSLLRLKTLSPDKLKLIEIDKKDERNLQIMGKVYSVSYYASIYILTFMILLFLVMGYRIPALVCVGAIYVQNVVLLIAKKHYDKKM